MADELVFYQNPMSRGRIVRWMLEEVGQPYRTELLNWGPAMKEAAYLVINPMGKVPAITHGGQVVTEVAAICAYLADAFPQAGLAPALAQRGAYYRWMFPPVRWRTPSPTRAWGLLFRRSARPWRDMAISAAPWTFWNTP